ncbi:hypothetical protein [Sulfurirhabdus autotrophica]|uniref:Uncharacterized protein n=1 Tax=Sulfurirhabdus autotrophica TaxID=1706046 RepID=A0A4R3XS33_9PROT|nr:hypothetical protein [Sulfurirhabdus autotrophica]TCV78145.1 hypothetical protein EDC63_1462 [Sulfurirhabdus autotrophica]
MRYFDRYMRGEYEAVWAELTNLGAKAQQAEVFDDVRAVALETMRRVRENINTIVDRLAGHGYRFDQYPDGSPIPYSFGPIVQPSGELVAQVNEFENLAGAIPLSLRIFWETVGAVSLMGRVPEGWPSYTDPLVVQPPDACILDFHDWRAAVEEYGENETGPFVAAIAPDMLHKDNVSGGAPYGFSLPNTAIDDVLMNERHNLPFVPYLRLAILKWGGFPGIGFGKLREEWHIKDGGSDIEWLLDLRTGLIDF